MFCLQAINKTGKVSIRPMQEVLSVFQASWTIDMRMLNDAERWTLKIYNIFCFMYQYFKNENWFYRFLEVVQAAYIPFKVPFVEK
jgi:hypothetical protein